MSTEFIAFQRPPGNSLASYDRRKRPEEQPPSVARIFKEAMEVREEVFVKEQKVPLEKELDEDDARSFHWVVYASVGSAPSSAEDRRRASGSDPSRQRSGSTATRLPVGTIRLVPPRHAPHGSQARSDHARADVHRDGSRSDSPLHLHTSGEPYIKLGRLATLKLYRGLGLAKLLIKAALSWAKDHPNDVLPPLNPAQVEAARIEGKEEQKPWRGLVLVHAQADKQRLWERFGFVRDDSMGTWIEEGIEHVGMWKKIDVKGDGPKYSLTGSPAGASGEQEMLDEHGRDLCLQFTDDVVPKTW